MTRSPTRTARLNPYRGSNGEPDRTDRRVTVRRRLPGRARPGLVGVAADLGDQLVDTVEPALVADARDELDVDRPAVQVQTSGRHFQHVHLDDLAAAAEGGSHPDVGDPVEHPVSQPHPDGVHPELGERLARGQAEVGGGEPDRPAPALPADHLASHGEPASEDASGLAEVAVGERGADGRRPVRPAGVPHQTERLELETVSGTHGGEQVAVSPLIATEAEVLTDGHDGGVETVDQHLGHELLGGKVAQRLVEVEYGDLFDGELGEQPELLVEGGEARRDRIGGEDRRRVVTEGDHGEREPQLGGSGPQGGDQRPVPAVNAVVHPHGDRRPPVGGRPRPVRPFEHSHARTTVGRARAPSTV